MRGMRGKAGGDYCGDEGGDKEKEGKAEKR